LPITKQKNDAESIDLDNRPCPGLTNGRRTGTYRSGEDIGANSIIPTISRADVADFMLKQLTGDTYLHKAPSVMY